MTNKNSNEHDHIGIMAFGHDAEKRSIASSEKPNYSDGAYAPCHKCFSHFTPAEMGIMGSVSESCMHFEEWIQLCVSCMNKEIDRLAYLLAVPEDKMYDSKWIAENILVFAKSTDVKSNVMNIEKLLFLLRAKNSKKV